MDGIVWSANAAIPFRSTPLPHPGCALTARSPLDAGCE